MSATTSANPSGAAIIDSITAINSLVLFALSGVLAMVAVTIALSRLFPTCFRRILASNAAKSNGSPQKGLPHRPVNVVRLHVLLVAAIFLFIDSINGLILISSAWGSRNANFVGYWIVRITIYVPSVPLFTIAFAQRIVVIVVFKPSWKRIFLRAVYFVSIFIWLLFQVIMGMGLAEMAALSPSPTPGEWMNAHFAPQWTTGFLLVLPILSIGGSLWSLQIAFGQSPQQGQSAPDSTEAPAASSSEGGSSTSGSHSAGLPANSTRAIVAGSHPVTKSRTTTIQYPITSTFKILSIVVFLTWCIGLYTFTIRTPIGVRPTAIASLMLSIDVLAECLFETLLRRNKRKVANPKPAEPVAGGSKH